MGQLLNLIDVLPVFSDWALLVLRLVFAGVFLAHGLPKIKDLKATHQSFGAMGFNPGWLWGTIVALLEPIGGLMILLGLWVPLFALLIGVEMLVATLWKVKNKQGFVGGFELDLLLAVAGLTLATNGSYLFSLQNFLGL